MPLAGVIIMELKLWRGAAIVLLAVCVLLGIGLALATKYQTIKTVTVDRIVKKNIIVRETFTPSGTLATRETIDKTEDKTNVKDSDIKKPVARLFVVSVSYSLTQGCALVGGGVVILDFVTVQALNPMALRFEPVVMASVLF